MSNVLEFKPADAPLDDDEMVYVRRQVASLREGQRRGVHLLPAENVACRLLATLDAANPEAVAALLAENRGLTTAIRAARFVGEAWIRDILEADSLRQTGMSHPVAMVLAALDGETDPVQVGLDPKYRVGFRAIFEEPRAAGPQEEGT